MMVLFFRFFIFCYFTNEAMIDSLPTVEKREETPNNNDNIDKHTTNRFQERDILVNQQKSSEDEENISDVEITCQKQPLLRAPSIQLIQRLNNIKLIFASIQHVLWITLSALPTVIIVCIIGFAYSKLPWARKGNSNQVNDYFDRWILFWFDDIFSDH